MFASWKGHISIMDLLLVSGASVDSVANVSCDTLLVRNDYYLS